MKFLKLEFLFFRVSSNMKQTQFISIFVLIATSLIFNAIAFPSHHMACLGNDKMFVAARTQVRDPLMRQLVEREDMPLVRRGTLYICTIWLTWKHAMLLPKVRKKRFLDNLNFAALFQVGASLKERKLKDGQKGGRSFNYITLASPEAL